MLLEVREYDWQTRSGVLASLACLMSSQSVVQIHSPTGVESPVGTAENVGVGHFSLVLAPPAFAGDHGTA